MYGLLGHYQASSQTLDFMKHLESVPCAYCSLRHTNWKSGRGYAHTAKTHYSYCSYFRTLHRPSYFRTASWTEEDIIFLERGRVFQLSTRVKQKASRRSLIRANKVRNVIILFQTGKMEIESQKAFEPPHKILLHQTTCFGGTSEYIKPFLFCYGPYATQDTGINAFCIQEGNANGLSANLVDSKRDITEQCVNFYSFSLGCSSSLLLWPYSKLKYTQDSFLFKSRSSGWLQQPFGGRNSIMAEREHLSAFMGSKGCQTLEIFVPCLRIWQTKSFCVYQSVLMHNDY